MRLPAPSMLRWLPRHRRPLAAPNMQRPAQLPPVCASRLVATVAVGDQTRGKRAFTEEDLRLFGSLSGDLNPIHFDPVHAARTRFRKPIVHGVLTLGFVSGLVAKRVPGAVITSLDVHFTAPLFVNEEMEGLVEVASISGRKSVLTFTCTKTQDAKVSLKGQAKVILPQSDGSQSPT